MNRENVRRVTGFGTILNISKIVRESIMPILEKMTLIGGKIQFQIETSDRRKILIDLLDMDILATIQLLGGATVYDLEKITGMPKGTIYNRVMKLVKNGLLNPPIEKIESGRLKKIYTVREPIKLSEEDEKDTFQDECITLMLEGFKIEKYHNKRVEEILKDKQSYDLLQPYNLLKQILSGFLVVESGVVKISPKTSEEIKNFLIHALKNVKNLYKEGYGKEEIIEALRKFLEDLESN